MTQGGLRLEDLAHQTGVSTRNIRAYQSLGLLRPPTLTGRTGFYDPDHVERLVTVRRLHGRGFSLAAIRELLDARDAGRTLEDVLSTPTAARPVRHRSHPELDPVDALAQSLDTWHGAPGALLPATFAAQHLSNQN